MVDWEEGLEDVEDEGDEVVGVGEPGGEELYSVYSE